MNASTPGSSGQILNSLVTVGLIFVVILLSESIYSATATQASRHVTLLDYTAPSDMAPITIYQNAALYKEAKVIGLSANERTGIEFAYSFYLFVLPSTFDSGDAVLKHVMHKGYQTPWPLMGPGVFMHGHENTMRIVMNTISNPYTHVDIKNIPIQKWFHVVLNCYKKGLDVFINGNLASRIPFKDTIPYQNFQDLHLFLTGNHTIKSAETAALGSSNMEMRGAFNGSLSNLIYTRYALSMNEIQGLMKKGPSTVVKQMSMDKPPYLADDWWAHQA
jgi:hypothetical protein